MDIAALKEAIGDEKFQELETYVTDLQGQRDQARTESISGRKALKDKVATLESAQAGLLDRLGIDSIDDIESLPDAQGMADAAQQFEAKLRRANDQLAAEKGLREAAEGRFMESQKAAHLSKALSAHEWVASDIVETFIAPRLKWDGDELLFETEAGRLTSVKDGVSDLAKSRPELLKPSGAGGAGVRSNQARGSEGTSSMTRAEFEALTPEKRLEASKAGVELH